MKIVQIAYHRNGTTGNGFHAVTFTDGRGKAKTTFVAVVFDEPGNIAVMEIAQLAAGIVGDPNKWRGNDEWGKELRKAISAWTIERYKSEDEAE